MADPSPSPDIEPLSRIQVLLAMGITAIVLLIAARLWVFFDQTPLLAVECTTNAVWLGIAIGLGISMASSLLYEVWDGYRESANYYLELVLRPLTWIDLVWLGLLPGMSEELLFRGVMLPGLGLNGFGLVMSSLCFGVMHFIGKQYWAYVLWVTIVGLLLGYSALATENLLVPIVAHVATNLCSAYLWKFRLSQQS
ncbi:MAG: CPBP family intramembrane metalloprotease [Leptolyngbyaceae cyanobacterium SL_7_1]|nr:CPBP family intramembrane metalloprotease [Leptolyngbyaceae cyanobacterium SL_7_1]